jgi:potassium-transporting ATPase KdpC subunit
MKKQTLIALKMLLLMTVITGIIYPLFITGVAQLLFNHKANGSLIEKNGIIIGSELIGQKSDSSIYFWSRPSAADNNPLSSGGSNLGPTSAKLKKQINDRKTKFISANMIKDTSEIPVEMLTASASGLDPDISPVAAMLQVNRVVKARNFNLNQKKELIDLINREIKKPQFSLFGEARINVFKLNLELDKL